MLSFIISEGQQLELHYTRTLDPFKWTVSSIEFNPDATIVSVSVKNTAYDTRIISFVTGEYAYTDKFPRGIKAISNSLKFNSNSKNVLLRSSEGISFDIIFPAGQWITDKEFGLKVGGYYTLNNIPIPRLTLSDINRQIMTWEQFYNKNAKIKLSFYNIKEVKQAIIADVEKWQKKGEFESTTAWKSRVNDITRNNYVNEITEKYSDQHEAELLSLKQEQSTLAKKYEVYKDEILKKYYQYKTICANNEFQSSNFELKPYDADNETFLIHNTIYGDILLPVPLAEAPSFKRNWFIISHNIMPVFVPNGEDVALSKLQFINDGKRYTYDSYTVAHYAITDVNYNFAPVEVADINFSNIEVNIKPINSVESNTVALNNQSSVLTQTTVSPTKKTILASEKSDVDISIPKTPEKNHSNTFAVIIANEKYDNVASVPYAENDGTILSKYFINTLGIPQDHVKVYENATFGNMVGAIKHINNLSAAFGEKLNLLFYYAGHGVPNEQTKQCMLLPVDGDALIPETCYDVEKIYDSLSKLNANSIIVLMDACFSGSLRGDGMLFASRSVKIKSDYAEPKGNMVIITASQGDETAFPYEKEQHGIFTYYLLKYLQQKKGDVTLGDMCEYLINQVKRQSVINNGKLQTPLVQYSPEIESSWRQWRLVE